MSTDNREIPEHSHLTAHFVLVVRGIYLTAALPDEGPCGPSALVFNPSGTTHRDRFRSGTGRFFTISLAPEIAAEIERKIYLPVALITGRITRTIQRTYSEFQQPVEFSSMILEGLALELVGIAGQSIDQPDRQIPRWLKTARDLIQDSNNSALSVKGIAREAGIHPIHLARMFRQFFRCSPGEYARQCRIERVKQLLLREKPSLAEIALQTGFKDQSHLTHAFKRSMSITPSAFRRTFRR